MSDYTIHIVASGDTAFDIANRYGVSIAAIKKLNPKIKWDKLQIGAKIKVPTVASVEIFTAKFDLKFFTLHSHLPKADTDKPDALADLRKNYKFGANSGQPKNSEIVKLLNLKKDTDYQLAKYQNVKSAGPIPEGEYRFSLSSTMSYQKSGGGWGIGGWSLAPIKPTKSFYGRNGFFLHDDGGDTGTLGCIGIIGSKNMTQIHGLLKQAYKAGQRVLSVKVQY